MSSHSAPLLVQRKPHASKEEKKEELLDEEQQDALIETLRSDNQLIDIHFHRAITILSFILIVILLIHIYASPSIPSFWISVSQHAFPNFIMILAVAFLCLISLIELQIQKAPPDERMQSFPLLVTVSSIAAIVFFSHWLGWLLLTNRQSDQFFWENLFWFTFSLIFLGLRYILFEMQNVHRSLDQLNTLKYKLKGA